MQPSVLSRFHPRGLLEAGPMGNIYEAFEKASGRPVAFLGFSRPHHAEVHAWAQATGAMTRELTRVRALDHPHILRLYEFGEEPGFYYVISEHFSGESLQRKFERKETFPPGRSLELLEQAGQALEYAARSGVTHGDLIPANLVVTREGSLKILNFGLSRCRPKRDSLYRAPEEIQGQEGDLRSDFFVLGILLYQMITGNHPFAGGTAEDVQRRILTATAPRIPGSDPFLSRILERLTARDIRVRYQRWTQVKAEIANRLIPDAPAPPPEVAKLHISGPEPTRPLRGPSIDEPDLPPSDPLRW